MDIIYEEVNDIKIETLKRSQYIEMSYFHHHSCYELFIIVSGERKMILQDKIYLGCAGDIFLIPPQYIHRTSGAEHTRILVNFTEEFLLRYFSQSMVYSILKCFDVFMINVGGEDFSKILEYIDLIDEYKDINGELLAIKLAELLILLSKKIDYNFENRTISTSMQLVSNILSYINSNYRSLADIRRIADKFYISEEYLCRVFKKHTGVTVVSYINGLKLKGAAKMLTEKNKKSINEISDMCGFSSPAYFGKIFKKNYGVSPLAYRSINMEYQEGSIKK